MSWSVDQIKCDNEFRDELLFGLLDNHYPHSTAASSKNIKLLQSKLQRIQIGRDDDYHNHIHITY